MYKTRLDYMKEFGAKATIVSEYFFESERKGIEPKDSRTFLIADNIISGNMLDRYTKTYQNTKTQIGWL